MKKKIFVRKVCIAYSHVAAYFRVIVVYWEATISFPKKEKKRWPLITCWHLHAGFVIMWQVKGRGEIYGALRLLRVSYLVLCYMYASTNNMHTHVLSRKSNAFRGPKIFSTYPNPTKGSCFPTSYSQLILTYCRHL